MSASNRLIFSSITLIVPFYIAFYSSAVTLSAVSQSHNSGSPAFYSDPSRLIILGIAYLLALRCIFITMHQSINLLVRNWLFLVLLVYILSSILWSNNPVKVVINTGHFMGYTIISVVAVQYYNINTYKLFPHLSLALSIIIALSIIVSLLFPSIGVHSLTGRWQGICGNPNTLGLVSILSVWANISSLLANDKNFKKYYFYFFLLLTTITLFGARSTTSILISGFIVISLIIFAKMEFDSRSLKMGKILGVCWLLISVFLYIYIVSPEILSIEFVLDSMGKDMTFTGRVGLWEMGWEWFIQRPFTGWSFDSLQYVLSQVGMAEGQFHNGYLDFAIRGGIIGLVLFTVLTIRYLLNIYCLLKYNYKMAIYFLVIVVAILIHNATEASIVRGTHLFWLMYVFSYYMVDCKCNFYTKNRSNNISEYRESNQNVAKVMYKSKMRI